MKFKKFFTAFALTGFLMAGALVSLGAAKEAKAAKASTDLGTFVFTEANADSTPTGMYGVNWEENDAPAGWGSDAFHPVDENSGTFVNGVRVGVEIKKVTPYAYYIAVPGGEIGTVATVKGTWDNGTYSFTVEEFVRQCVAQAGKWEYVLEDYDVLSLKDANMPDFEKVAINTEDASGYGYIGYDESGYAKKYIAKRGGIFGLTNQTGSYSFQFYFEADGKLTDWVTIRIGATGGWTTGHHLKFNMHNTWHDDGCVQIEEWVGDTKIQGLEVRSDISDGERLLEMGSIRVKGYENKYYVFFKNNGVVSFGQYWDLEEGIRSTKVGIYTSSTNATIKNSVEPVATKFTLSADSTGSSLYFNTTTDVLPFISSWGLWFSPQGADGFTYNGLDASVEKWNYFKKVGATNNAFFFNFPDLGITPAEGDVFHLGGIFKLADYIGEETKVTMVYKICIEACDFQFDGEEWHAINPNYEAADFSKDLLKMTLSICTGVAGDNHDALAEVWAVLADASHYGALALDEKGVLSEAVADKEIVVPTTAEGVDEMNANDAVAAAMYRYDYCTSKYSLTSFIEDRPKVPNTSSNYYGEISSTESNSAFLIIAIVASAATISLLGVLIIKKRKQR